MAHVQVDGEVHADGQRAAWVEHLEVLDPGDAAEEERVGSQGDAVEDGHNL